MTRLDELRAAHPELGFAVYAIDPATPVTLEIYTPDGQVYRFDGPTEAAVLNRAFPPTAPVSPDPTPNIFD